jgi:hypothetical protein
LGGRDRTPSSTTWFVNVVVIAVGVVASHCVVSVVSVVKVVIKVFKTCLVVFIRYVVTSIGKTSLCCCIVMSLRRYVGKVPGHWLVIKCEIVLLS